MMGEAVTTGVIETASVSGHAPAPQIRYTIVVGTPNGGVRRLQNVRPIGQTWTDLYGVDVIPHPRGTPVSVSEVAGRIMVYAPTELPYAVDCDGMPIDTREPRLPINDPITGLPNNQSNTGSNSADGPKTVSVELGGSKDISLGSVSQ
jgi:hypothetical protein